MPPTKSTKRTPQSNLVIDADVLPTPHQDDAEINQRVSKINLNDLDAVRREMARVYRDMRTYKIASQDGTRFVYVLGEIRKVFEAVDMDKRISALEVDRNGQ